MSEENQSFVQCTQYHLVLKTLQRLYCYCNIHQWKQIIKQHIHVYYKILQVIYNN